VACEPTTALRGADLLAEALIAGGVDTLFGVPGDTGVVFYDALSARSHRLRHVLARDERHAATMADAYARVANRVGVVEVSSGGGTTYAVGGLGEAMAAGVPVLVVTSDIHRGSRGTGALTEIDQLALFSAVTKWRTVVEHAREIPAAVQQALIAATTGRPGPVAVIVPEDVLDEAIEDASRIPSGPAAIPAERTGAAAQSVAAAAAMLAAAARPLIIAGSGVHSSGAWPELAGLAQRAAIPVATTIHGKAALPDSHPLSLGVIGNNGARDYANDFAARADAVLIVGSRANATDTNSWTGPPRRGVPIAQIDIAPDRAGRNFPDAIALVGDAAAVLAQLAEQIEPATDDTQAERVREIAKRRAEWLAAGPRGDTAVADGQLVPADIVTVLNTELGSDTIIVADPGTPTPNLSAYWETTTAARTVIAPRGHGPMGYAIPAAIGAAFARPGQPIIALTGDGSFAMACGELETIARFQLPILCVQMTNHSLGWIKMLQHLYSGQRYFGVDPGPIDAVAVARGCGVAAERVTGIGRLTDLARRFAAEPSPFYIDVEVPHMIDYTPPVSSWINALPGRSGRSDGSGGASRPVY
jgi:acetolactate synthase-1/2/3 large subunit